VRVRPLLLAVCLVVTAPLAGGVAHAAKPSKGGGSSTAPSSMSALGDSITRGFNAGGWFVDYPSRSWSTGTETTVNSHYLRLQKLNTSIKNNAWNDARSGAKIADLPGQASTAVSRGVQYVTIEMGANDACTSSESTMTPVETYRAHFEQAMATLNAGLPNAKVFVASIPDVKRLWYIGKDSSSARTAWSSYRICQSMLANPTSTAQEDVDRRDRVQQRVVDFNSALASVCAQYTSCKYDGNAVFGYPFVLSQVSTWDYFHPSTSGQAVLADVTWKAGFSW
jgi:lysophospholipase L1-like esterase